ncbi:MAG: TrkA C-terminal domain-containing protein [Oscillospiraceae bacterium]
MAKKLGVKHTIARIRNPEYEKQLRFMREELGLSMAINPEKVAAREIARVLRFPTAMKIESFSKGRLELVEYRLSEKSHLHGMRLSDLYGNIKVRVLICAVSRKGETVIPSGDFELQSGDKIYLTSSPKQLEQFFRHLGVPEPGVLGDDCGCQQDLLLPGLAAAGDGNVCADHRSE